MIYSVLVQFAINTTWRPYSTNPYTDPYTWKCISEKNKISQKLGKIFENYLFGAIERRSRPRYTLLKTLFRHFLQQ